MRLPQGWRKMLQTPGLDIYGGRTYDQFRETRSLER